MRCNNQYISMMKIVVFNKYTMDVMKNSTLLEWNMLKY